MFLKRYSSRPKIQNVVQFIHVKCGKFNRSRITDNDIQQIVQQICEPSSSQWLQLFRNSIDSYDTNIPPITIIDPIEMKLLHTDMYTPYVGNMFDIQSLNLQFYDLRGCNSEASLPDLLTDWVKRRKGILMNKVKDSSHTFTLLVKKDVSEKYKDHEETLDMDIYPNCK